MSDEVEIVTTPVFDMDKRILGYLTHDAAYLSRKNFYLKARSAEATSDSRDGSPSGWVNDLRFAFELNLLSAARSGADEVSECPVLIVDTAGGLDRLHGFKFFAEVHGKTRVLRRSA